VLVFSIAFGISVDDTIHFLAKYRQELNMKSWNIREAVLLALKETGVSMMYTSIVLFFGFMMFAISNFEGTRFLGLLVSISDIFRWDSGPAHCVRAQVVVAWRRGNWPKHRGSGPAALLSVDDEMLLITSGNYMRQAHVTGFNEKVRAFSV
jgi:hypothetical protein